LKEPQHHLNSVQSLIRCELSKASVALASYSMEGSNSPNRGSVRGRNGVQRVHAIALQNRPEVDLHNGEFAIAVLQHDKPSKAADSSDFLWFKVKRYVEPFHDESALIVSGNTLFPNLKGAYEKRTGVKVDFKFAHKAIGDRVQMSELNHFERQYGGLHLG